MSKNANKNQSIKEASSAKKAALLESTDKKNTKPYLIISVCALIVIAGVLFYMVSGNQSSPNIIQASEDGKQASFEIKEVTYPVTTFDDGKARHYSYEAGNGITIKYFILKSSDGVVRAAYDACDVCWPAGKGYFQEGDVMVCRNCGRQFASVKINEVKGGCNPGPLERTVVGDNLVIQVKNILEGAKYFNFSGRG